MYIPIIKYIEFVSSANALVEWLMRRTSNLKIANCMGSNPVRDKLLFP